MYDAGGDLGRGGGEPASASRSPHILDLAAPAKIPRMTPDSHVFAFSAPYAPEDEVLAAELLASAALPGEAEARIDRREAGDESIHDLKSSSIVYGA